MRIAAQQVAGCQPENSSSTANKSPGAIPLFLQDPLLWLAARRAELSTPQPTPAGSCPPLPWAAPSGATRSGLNGICLALFPFKAGSQKVILIYKLKAWQSSSRSTGGQVGLSLLRGVRVLGVLMQEGQEFLQYLIKLLTSEHYSVLVKTIPELCP